MLHMSLFLATLLPGLFLTALGVLLLLNNPGGDLRAQGPAAFARRHPGALRWRGAVVSFRASPTWATPTALSAAPIPWVVGFAALGVLSIKYVPDFLAVRGLSILILLAATPLLDAAFMEYGHPQRLFMVTAGLIAASSPPSTWPPCPTGCAIFSSGCSPLRGAAGRLGAGLLVYGILLTAGGVHLLTPTPMTPPPKEVTACCC